MMDCPSCGWNAVIWKTEGQTFRYKCLECGWNQGSKIERQSTETEPDRWDALSQIDDPVNNIPEIEKLIEKVARMAASHESGEEWVKMEQCAKDALATVLYGKWTLRRVLSLLENPSKEQANRDGGTG